MVVVTVRQAQQDLPGRRGQQDRRASRTSWTSRTSWKQRRRREHRRLALGG